MCFIVALFPQTSKTIFDRAVLPTYAKIYYVVTLFLRVLLLSFNAFSLFFFSVFGRYVPRNPRANACQSVSKTFVISAVFASTALYRNTSLTVYEWQELRSVYANGDRGGCRYCPDDVTVMDDGGRVRGIDVAPRKLSRE